MTDLYKYHWCKNCKKVQPYDIRENDDECSDMCCSVCHYIAACLHKYRPIYKADADE